MTSSGPVRVEPSASGSRNDRGRGNLCVGANGNDTTINGRPAENAGWWLRSPRPRGKYAELIPPLTNNAPIRYGADTTINGEQPGKQTSPRSTV